MLDKLQERVVEIENAINQIQVNHRDLMVRLDEIKYLINMMEPKKDDKNVEETQ